MKSAIRSLFALALCVTVCSVAHAAVGVNKSFTPNSVVSTQQSTLTVVLLNPNSAVATSARLTDTLPAGVLVANPLVVGMNTCGFSTASIVPGTGSIAVSGGTIPAISGGVAGQCEIQVNVDASSPSTYLNSIGAGAVSSSQGTNAQAAQATLVVSAPTSVTGPKAFAPTNVHGNGTASTLTITLTNPNAIPLTNAAITDSLPAAITIASPANAGTTCAGTATPSSSASNPATIALSGGTIPANGSCTLFVDVVARNPNALTNANQTNTIAAGALATTEGATNSAIAANINVQTGGSVAKAFSPNIIAAGGTSNLTITVTNLNASALTPITFTDTLPATVTATALPVSSCGGAITTVPAQPAPPPYSAFTLTGGTLGGVVGPGPGSTTCTVTAPVTATAAGTNTLPANSYGGVAIAAASATLSVSAITGSKSFTVPALQTGSTTMTITLNNLTVVAATITALRDDLTTMGAGFTVHTGATPGGTCGTSLTSPTPGTLITTTGGTIPANGSCTITLPIDIGPTAATGNRTNTIPVATAVNGVHTSTGNNTVAITGTVNVQRALTVSKAFAPSTIEEGAVSRLTVTMVPTVNLTSVGFSDDLTSMSAGFALSATPNPVASGCGAGTVTANAGATSFSLSGGTLTAGTNCTVAVNVATPLTAGTFTNHLLGANTTTAEGVTTSDVTANLILVNTSVTVNKSFSPTTVPIGATNPGNPNFSTLSIQIRNNNPGATNLTGAGLTDVFPIGMLVANPANASFSGAGCGGATITAPVGASQIVLSTANVNANAICTLSVRVVGTIAGNLIDTIPPGAINSAQGVSNPLQGTATLSVTGTVNLSITKTDGVASAIPGGTTTYTIVVSNAGPNDVTGLGLNDTPPAGVTFSSWTCAATAGSACPASGSGPIATNVTVLNGGSITFTVNAAIASGATGSITNTASLAVPGSVIDTNPVTSASDTDTLTPQADLAVTKTDGVTTVVPGTSTTYTIVVSNNGPSDAPGATVTDTLPAGISSATWTCAATAGSSCPASGLGNINVAVNLLAGGSATFTLVATISQGAVGNLVNTATVTAPAGVTDPNPANNSATDTDTLTPLADLAITKTDGVTSVSAGGTTSYTIVVSNSGPSAGNGAVFTDPAVANLNVTSVTCGSASGGAACPTVPNTTVALMQGAGIVIPTLPAGGSVTFTVNATVAGSATGTISNTATVTAPAGVTDPNPANNSATDTDTRDPQADLAITKTDGVASATPGGSMTYTIVVTNTGPSNVTGATVSRHLPAVDSPATLHGGGQPAAARGSRPAAAATSTTPSTCLPAARSPTRCTPASVSAADGQPGQHGDGDAPAG